MPFIWNALAPVYSENKIVENKFLFSLSLDSPYNFFNIVLNILCAVAVHTSLWKTVVFQVPIEKIVWDPKEIEGFSGSLG